MTTPSDGHKQFDFYLGRWNLHNRKLRNVLDPECTEWTEHEATTDVVAIPGGLGNVEFTDNRAEPAFDGLTLRLYDPQANLWRVYWASSRAPGELGTPIEGKFADDGASALFEADEEIAGRLTRVRVEWTGIAEGEPHWVQSFSYDGGKTWAPNWFIDSTRPA